MVEAAVVDALKSVRTAGMDGGGFILRRRGGRGVG